MKQLGISPVIATVILTGILLTTITVAVYFSTSLIDANRQMMEYEAAKDQLTYAATVLEQVAFGTGGSRYIRFSLTSTGINFMNYGSYLDFRVCNVGGVCSQLRSPIPLQGIAVKGGPLVTTVSRLLYPETGDLSVEQRKLLVEPGVPLVIVYENFSRGAYAYLIAQRGRMIYNGAFNVTERAANVDCDWDGQLSNLPRCKFNFYTLQIVRLEFGRLGGSGTVPVVFRNVGVDTYNYTFSGSRLTVTAMVRDQANRILQQQSVTIDGPPANGCVVIIKIARINVSTG
ncbi:MAG: hypothetical protein NZ954_01910 [Thermofilaceae archaeon]|nr:hypothetical protein [Thermofilaceae archaeon]MDW8003427.1 hypothetical protein [Thermofilaceae archaeon]